MALAHAERPLVASLDAVLHSAGARFPLHMASPLLSHTHAHTASLSASLHLSIALRDDGRPTQPPDKTLSHTAQSTVATRTAKAERPGDLLTHTARSLNLRATK